MRKNLGHILFTIIGHIGLRSRGNNGNDSNDVTQDRCFRSAQGDMLMCNRDNPSAPNPQQPDTYHGHCRKRRGRRFFKFLVFLGILWMTATLSYRHGHKVVGFFQMKKLSREMDLTWYQKERLMDIFFDSQQKSFVQRTELHKIKGELYHLLDKDGLTQQELNTFIHNSLAKVEKILQTHSANLLKARNTLSPYQRKVLIVRLQQIERKRNRWRRHHARYSYHSSEERCKEEKSATSQPSSSSQTMTPSERSMPALEKKPVKPSNPAPIVPQTPASLIPATRLF